MVATIRFYVATSLDGFIATPDGGVDWLTPFDDQDFGYAAFFENVGLLVMGRATYEQTLSFGPWPYGHKRCHVLSRRPLYDIPSDGVSRWDRDVPDLVRHARAHDDGDTWVVGGAALFTLFLRHGAVDQIDLFVMPLWLGQGLRLWPEAPPRLMPSLSRTLKHPCGVVQLTYRLRRPFMDQL